jgi:hypothetical protein
VPRRLCGHDEICRLTFVRPSAAAGEPLQSASRLKTYGVPVIGEAGLLIAFGADMVHAVTPVTHGERYTIVSWFV